MPVRGREDRPRLLGSQRLKPSAGVAADVRAQRSNRPPLLLPILFAHRRAGEDLWRPVRLVRCIVVSHRARAAALLEHGVLRRPSVESWPAHSAVDRSAIDPLCRLAEPL